MTTTTTTTPTDRDRTGERIFNFSAGPSALPEEVLRQAKNDIFNIAGTGIGILEHSHRGSLFTRIIEEAEAACRRIAGIPDDYHVLFLQGGATLQFAMVPMSFLPAGKVADYLDTGSWTSKAIKEAKLLGNLNVAFDGGPTGYDHIPAANELSLSRDAAYLYFCSNNTIVGTEYSEPPATDAPLVCDASSDILSRPIEVARYALIFAGAQKNLGPAGCTLVIVSKDFLRGARDGLPSMLDYRQHAAQGSRLNTAPVFCIYFMGEVFKWIERQGGLEVMARRNREKAGIIYDAIDSAAGVGTAFYRGVARSDSRSMMNVTFRTPSDNLDEEFVAQARQMGMEGLKGHRSVGGLRASIYNAFPRAGCEALAALMKDFAKKNS